MLHIKLKLMECRAPYKHILCPYTHLDQCGWVKRSKDFFLNMVMLHIKLKGKKYRPTCKKNFDLIHTPGSWSG